MQIDISQAPEEFANKLMRQYEPFVYCFIGSSMLTNTEDEKVIQMNCAHCAIKSVELSLQCMQMQYDAEIKNKRLVSSIVVYYTTLCEVLKILKTKIKS